MSLFDVIKYPISIPPTLEELESLPRQLLIDWMKSNGFHFFTANEVDTCAMLEEVAYAPSRAFSYYNNRFLRDSLPERKLLELKQLRQLIRDYNEPI